MRGHAMLGAGEIVLTGTQRKAAWVREIKNMSVLTGDDHVQILISETEITARVNQLAKQITETYSDTDQISWLWLACYGVLLFLSPIWCAV